MQFANNEDEIRTHINDANPNAEYFCPCCDAPVIQRRGQVNIPHFAHKKGHLCTDTWHYEKMSEWHLFWQSKYPLENREISIINDLGRHRADVLINNTVIEFQHSHISAAEFDERNKFYTACRYRVIWLFDVRDIYNTQLTDLGANQYCWKRPPKMLTNFDLYGNVQVYFHLLDGKQQNGEEIIRLIEYSKGSLNYFRSAPSEHYTEAEFVELTSHGAVDRAVDMSGKDKVFHTLYTIRRTNGKMECYGCPINEDGYAPRIHEHGRTACNECAFCVAELEASRIVKCAGRYREHLDHIETVLKNHPDFLSYIAKDGSIRKTNIDLPPNPATSIWYLAQKYNASEMIVRNIDRNTLVWIKGDAVEMVRKYKGKIYGFLCRNCEKGFSKNSMKIYGSMESVWIVEWFKPKS